MDMTPIGEPSTGRQALIGSALARLVVVFVFVVAACSTEPLPDVVAVGFDCAEPIDQLSEPPDGYAEVLDVVALPVLELHQQGQPQEDEVGVTRRFSKMGLVIRRDTPFTIRVTEDSRPNALISWSNTGQPGPVEGLAVPGCAGPVQWLVYPGGVWVVDPACVTLEVEVDGQVESVQLPIGERCN